MNLSDSDPITHILGDLYLPKWTATEFAFGVHWGLKVPASVGCMYVIKQGTGWVQVEGTSGDPIQLTSGDHIIIPHGMTHRLFSGPGATFESIHDRLSNPTWYVPTNGAVEPTVILYGQFSLDCLMRGPLDPGLPEFIHLNHHRDRELVTCLPLLDLLHSTRQEAASGWQLTVRKLAELVFVKTIGVQLVQGMKAIHGNEGDFQIMRAATDSLIGCVVKEIIEKPEAPWTVPQMAKMARISKSTFSERFRKLAGQPPLQYLTDIRMQKACQLLGESKIDIADVATLVGYESPSSFSNAFRRWRGKSPAEYRRDTGTQR